MTMADNETLLEGARVRADYWKEQCERQSTERSKLAELLLEALEWNWCDDDYPEGLRDECEAAAKAASGTQK